MNQFFTKLRYDAEKGIVLKVSCDDCKRETNHVVLATVDEMWEEYITTSKQYIHNGIIKHQIIKCQGCDSISFRVYIDFVDEQPSEVLYPERLQQHIECKEFNHVPNNIYAIYKESVTAFNENLHILCAAGLRSIVEGICQDKGINGGLVAVRDKYGETKEKFSRKLEGKIVGLCQQQFLTRQHSEVLHEHRYLGNEAIHELSVPSQNELALAIDILEHTFRQMYDLPSKAEKLKNQIKKRKYSIR